MSSETAALGQQPTVLANVQALLPEIKARAEEIEQARAVPRDLAEKLRSAGVFRRYVPRSRGRTDWSVTQRPLADQVFVLLSALRSRSCCSYYVLTSQ